MNSTDKLKTEYLNAHPQLRDQLLEGLEELFACAPPSQLRDTIEEIYDMYIVREHAAFPIYFEHMAIHMFQIKLALRKIHLALNPEEASNHSL